MGAAESKAAPKNFKASQIEQETLDILRLIRSENVGIKTFYDLVRVYGSAKCALEKIPEIAARSRKNLKVFSKQDAELEITNLHKLGANLISYKDPYFSHLLAKTPDCPPILSFLGDISLLKREILVALVGARNCSVNGKIITQKIASQLGSIGVVTVSGLARGIDTAAHQYSINNGTIAVIAGGIDHIYPPENHKLYKEISETGLVLAELPIGCHPSARHFPQRNRIIAGLSSATIVIEAGINSGSLITARMALEYNREVMAVPGFPLDPRYQGSNKLIKEGAYLLESAEDAVNQIKNIPTDHFMSEINDNNYVSLLENSCDQLEVEQVKSDILNQLSSCPIDMDMLLQQINCSLPVFYSAILELELSGKIIRGHGNTVCLIF